MNDDDACLIFLVCGGKGVIEFWFEMMTRSVYICEPALHS
jgi:hypothetical protein